MSHFCPHFVPCSKNVPIIRIHQLNYQQAGDTLTSRSEFQWDSDDQRWGMGDYRLPNQMTTAMDGSAISPTTWPNKGIDRTLNGEVS